MEMKSKYVAYMPDDVPEEEKWFWTKRYQKKLKEAEASEALGTFDNFEDLCKALGI